MKVKITADSNLVAKHLDEQGSTVVIGDVDPDGTMVDGILEDVIDAVLATATFEFDREDVEVATVLHFPQVN